MEIFCALDNRCLVKDSPISTKSFSDHVNLAIPVLLTIQTFDLFQPKPAQTRLSTQTQTSNRSQKPQSFQSPNKPNKTIRIFVCKFRWLAGVATMQQYSNNDNNSCLCRCVVPPIKLKSQLLTVTM